MKLHSSGMHSISLAVVVVLAGVCLSGPKAMAYSYSGGAGTAENPYLISTSDDLVQLSRSSSDWESHFRMTKDIDMANVKGFRPIAPEKLTANGLQDLSFTGVFDGNGHVISNLVIDKPTSDSVGLFGHVGENGEIRKLGLEDVRITGKDRVGGLVGTSEQGRITLCYAQGSVTGHEDVGCLVGSNISSSIISSYASGNVKGNSSIGGLVGVNIESTISSCYARGTVTGEFFGIGGLAGLDIQSHIVSSYARVSVNGRGGLMGGLLGEGLDSQIQSCYAAGPVGKESRNKKGGLVGKSFQETQITASFWDVDVTGQNSSAGGGTGLTTSEMQKKATFEEAGWDFETVWVMPDSGYPELRMLEVEETRPTGTNHADSPTRSTSSNRYSGGTGTTADPYLIANPDDLVRLSQRSPDWGNHFRMTEDIDMSDVKGFTPIAPDTSMEADFQGPKFAGTFNGDGHVISNLVIDSPDQKHLGFFGGAGLGSEIRNLHLQNVMITGNDAVGALVGLVEQGHIFSSSSTGTLQGQIAIGGLVGANRNGEITSCHANASIKGNKCVGGLVGFNGGQITSSSAASSVKGDSAVGGLVGATAKTSNISKCSASGFVEGQKSVGGLIGANQGGKVVSGQATGEVTGEKMVGGLVGENREGEITQSCATGKIKGDFAGGLVGVNKQGNIMMSFATGQIMGIRGADDGLLGAGGLVGGNIKGRIKSSYATGSVRSDVKGEDAIGGLVGFYSDDSHISVCYSTGAVENGETSGGLVGLNYYTSSITSSFWDVYTSTQQKSYGGTGLPTDKMQTKSTFKEAAWDFDSVWVMPKSGYPQFQWQEGMPSLKDQVQQNKLRAYSGGTGTSDDPFLIGKSADLVLLRKSPGDWNLYFLLANDIDMVGVKNFSPIAPDLSTDDEFQGTLFTGVFDGDGHVISNLTINRPRGTCIGFMGGIGEGCVIRDLGLENVTIKGEEVTGGLAAYNKKGEIVSCHVKGSIAGKYVTGGLVGFIHEGTVTSCSFSGKVNSDSFIAGGLIGGTIGGRVQFCSAAGSVKSRQRVGGLMGQNRGCSIASSYATNEVSGRRRVGGLVGENLAGSHVESSYSTGAVTGKEKFGGLIGEDEGEIDSSFWDVDASGQNASAGSGTGLTTAEMQKKATFEEAGWDFETVWVMPDSGYPQLRVLEKKDGKVHKNKPRGAK